MTEFDKTMAQWQAFKERAERIRAMMHQRAIAAYCRAFGNEPTPTSQLDCCVIGNSILSMQQGKPWREVDYSQMRLAKRLVDNWDTNRICDRFFTRKVMPAMRHRS
jgi:hypothetical protein